MTRRLAVLLLAALGPLAASCGLLASPGDYLASSGDGDAAIVVPAPPSDGAVSDVDPGPAATIAVLSGERNPTGPGDDPAWAGDLWLADLDAAGRVVRFRIALSAPI